MKCSIVVKGSAGQAEQACMLHDVSVVRRHSTNDHETTLIVESDARVLNGWFSEASDRTVPVLPVGSLLLWRPAPEEKPKEHDQQKIYKVSFTVRAKDELEASAIAAEQMFRHAGKPVDFKVEQAFPYDDDAELDCSLPEPING